MTRDERRDLIAQRVPIVLDVWRLLRRAFPDFDEPTVSATGSGHGAAGDPPTALAIDAHETAQPSRTYSEDLLRLSEEARQELLAMKSPTVKSMPPPVKPKPSRKQFVKLVSEQLSDTPLTVSEIAQRVGMRTQVVRRVLVRIGAPSLPEDVSLRDGRQGGSGGRRYFAATT